MSLYKPKESFGLPRVVYRIPSPFWGVRGFRGFSGLGSISKLKELFGLRG